MTAITIDSSRFGTLEVEPADVIEFPIGLVGLPGRRYTVVTPDPNSPFQWLHSLDDPSLALPITNPLHFFADYAVKLQEEDVARVGADEAAIWVVVRAGSELADFSANLHAPIVIANGHGHQVINALPYPVRVALFPDVAVQAA
jgi:flagellar assembly factor FliW